MESFPSDKRAPFPMALSVVTLLKLSVLPSTDIYAAPITATQVLNRTENTRNGENPIKLIGVILLLSFLTLPDRQPPLKF